MSPEKQSIIALLVVAVAVLWLAWRALAKRRAGGCGDGCGAVSPDVKRLQAHLRRKR